MKNLLNNRVAIVGIGQTEFSKNSGRSEMQMAFEAITKALADAGLTGAEVEGTSTYTSDNNIEDEIFRLIGGKNLKFFSRVEYSGGGAGATIMHAAMAIACGVCKVAIVYRSMNERSNYRFGDGQFTFNMNPAAFSSIQFTNWSLPYGLFSPMSMLALTAHRYMYEFGVTSEDFGRVAVAARDFASTNPAAFFYQKPLTLPEHQNSRWIARPLRLFDCCQESDGAVALVLASAEYAKDLRQKPVFIKAAAQGATDETGMFVEYYGNHAISLPEKKLVAQQLYEMSGLEPKDMHAAIFYDHCTPYVMLQLEACGFCGIGEAKDFIKDGHISRGGKLPVNPHGGLLGEAYIHGINGLAEAVRQVRGTSVNQIDRVENVIVTGGDGLPTSGVIIGTL